MKRAISFSLFIIIALIAWWSTTEDHGDTDPLYTNKSAHFVEVFMNDFVITEMDKEGKPTYTLNGSRLTKRNRSNTTEITQPVFELLQQSNNWHITADKAVLNDDNETIDLLSNVVMLQKNSEPAVTIRTQSLHINTKKQTAQTTAKVDITRGYSVLHSDGMVFNNITSKLDLSSNVNGYFLPDDK